MNVFEAMQAFLSGKRLTVSESTLYLADDDEIVCFWREGENVRYVTKKGQKIGEAHVGRFFNSCRHYEIYRETFGPVEAMKRLLAGKMIKSVHGNIRCKIDNGEFFGFAYINSDSEFEEVELQ